MVEVVPFLVLAVGVDNIFIIVQSYQVKMNMSDNTQCLLSGRVAERGAAFMSHPAVLLVIVL